MPSIFIWKADVPNTSTKFIRYYSGSNWWLEDNDYTSNSYQYLHQIVIPGYDNSAITFHVKKMPQDWIGSDLLEVHKLPYLFLKSDDYGTLEHLGNWMRFISHKEMDIDSDNIEKEFATIKAWTSVPTKATKPIKTKMVQESENIHEKYQAILTQCYLQRKNQQPQTGIRLQNRY